MGRRLEAPLFTCGRFECVPATSAHALLRLDGRLRAGAGRPAGLLIAGAGERRLLPALPGSLVLTPGAGGVEVRVAFAVEHLVLAHPGLSYQLSLGGSRVDLPRPELRLADGAEAQAEAMAAALGKEVDRLTERLAEAERLRREQAERTARLARRHGALLRSSKAAGPRARRPRATRAVALAALLVTGSLAATLALDRTAAPPAPTQQVLAPLHPSVVPSGSLLEASAAAHRDVPTDYLRRYQLAGRRYGLDWTILAAVGEVEGDHGRTSLAGVRTGANHMGAAGPAQFLGPTWRRYGLDGDDDGLTSVYDPDDAIPAMASYLRASGAPENWQGALMAYNHSARFVADVLNVAQRYRAGR